MTREEHEKELSELATKLPKGAVIELVTSITDFSCIPRRISEKNWCSSCQSCWAGYLRYLIEKYK